MRKKYTQNEINKVIDSFKQTNNYKQTSELLNIPLSSCKSILGREGYSMGIRNSNLNIEDIDELIFKCKNLLLEKEYSFNRLCKIVGVNCNTFRKYLKINKIEGILEKCLSSNYNKRALTDENKLKIIQLEQQGKGNDVIGKILNINGSTVRRYLIEYYGLEKYKERHSIEKFNTPYYVGFINDRGDRFHSTLEMLVADFLFENNIKYKTQKYIEFPNKKSKYPDFWLEDYKIYIEVFGMSSVSFYIDGMNEKIKLYKKYKIPFIGLYYDDFKENKWKKILINKLNIKNEKTTNH